MKDFLKNNVFLAVLAAVVIVGGAVLVVLNAKVSSARDKNLQDREKVAEDVSRLTPRSAVNSERLAAQEQRNTEVEQEAARVEAMLAQVQNYPVITVVEGGKSIKAFPFDPNESGLTEKITRQYAEMWGYREGGWLNQLHATAPPQEGDAYLLERERYWQKEILRQKLEALKYVSVVLWNTGVKLEKELAILKQKAREAGAEGEGAPAGSGTSGGGASPHGDPGEGLPAMGPGGMVPGGVFPGELRRPSEPGAQNLERLIETVMRLQQTSVRTITDNIQLALTTLERIEGYRKEYGQSETSPDRRRQLLELIRFDRDAFEKLARTIESDESTLKKNIISTYRITDTGERTSGSAPSMTGVTEPSATTDATDYIEAAEKLEARRFTESGVPLQNAITFARPDAIKERAKAGAIYADIDAFNRIFTEGRFYAPPAQLWEMQFNTWTMQDILSAIRETNEEAFAGLPEAERTVPNAAVKRLLAINVRSDYYKGEDFRPSASSGFGLEPEFVPGGSSRRRTPQPQPTITARADTLTQHFCTKKYDVIHYNFTVVMPLRNLAMLLENLQANKLHNVLRVELGKTEDILKLVSAKRPDLFYYGVEPVTYVTIHGELLLLTDWERELMPVEALKAQLDGFFPALRTEDRERLRAVRAG